MFVIDYGFFFHYAKNMERMFCPMVRAAIAQGLERGLQIAVDPKEIRLPARGAAAGCAVALAHGADAIVWAALLDAVREEFPPVLGAPLLSAVRGVNGWLLFDLTDALYTAAMHAAVPSHGQIPEHHENYPLHRLRMLARYDAACTCPTDPHVQRALLLAFAAEEAPNTANRIRAEEALLTMAYHLPPRERIDLLSRCGGVARAAARLLYGV